MWKSSSLKFVLPGIEMIGVTRSLTSAVTTAPNAAPTTTATARSTTFPRRMNARKSFSMGASLSDDGLARVHLGPQQPGQPLTVERGVAHAYLIQLCPFEVQVQVVLPREPDP